jgi:hypothetical protein
MATPQSIQGLFGGMGSPEEMQQQANQARAVQFAQLTPDQQLGVMGYKGGANLGRGLAGAFGVDVQDPAIKRATMLRQMASQYDTNTVEGLKQMAAALQGSDPELGFQVMQRAQAMELEQAKTTTQKAQTLTQEAQAAKYLAEQGKILSGEAKDEQLRAELASLPPEADDKAVENIVRKYGKPDDIFKTLERRSTAEANRIAKAELEREKAEQRAIEKQRDQDFKQQMAAMSAAARSSMTGVQRELAEQRLSDLKSKQTDKEEKKEASKQFAVNHANKVIDDVTAAKSLVSGTTTGLVGAGSSFVPGTDAYNLKQRLLTIKANLGFDRLQQMRDASPTGGALGQVAVQELQALQATVGSLELGQTRQELQQNLDKIELHYNNWLSAVGGTPTKPPAPSAAGWSIKPKS